MKSSSLIYKLLENEGVVRRDLPESSPVRSLVPPNTDLEFDSLLARARTSARNHQFRNSLRPPQPAQPRLVSSSEGPLTQILFTIPVGNTSGEFADIFNKLFETLPATTALVCLVNTSSKSDVERWLSLHNREQNSTVIESPNHVGFSIWAQDAYAVSVTATNETYFIEPLSFLRYADAVISDYVSNATGLKNFQTPLYFQGGNILVGDDFWLIGLDYPEKTLGYVENAIIPNPGELPEQLVRRLYTEYLDHNRQLTYVGSTVPVPSEQLVLVRENGQYYIDHVFQGNQEGTAQPLFHIDMFLTLAGRDAANKYQVFVGDPSLAPPPASPNWNSYAMQNVYDSVARSLQNAGMSVIRNPLPLTFFSKQIQVSQLNDPTDPQLYAIYQQLTQAGVTQVALRSWYFATANNALVQVAHNDKRVWLPTYGHGTYSYLAESDAANKRIWERLGFTVTLLPSFHRLARGLGAVHCIQKYLARG